MPPLSSLHQLQPNKVALIFNCFAVTSAEATDSLVRVGIAALALLAAAKVACAAAENAPGPKVNVPAQIAALPIRFEPNAGQTAQEVKFLSRGPGYTLFLTSTEAVLSLRANSRQSQL